MRFRSRISLRIMKQFRYAQSLSHLTLSLTPPCRSIAQGRRVSPEGINELKGIADDINEAHWYQKGGPKFKFAGAVNRLLASGWFNTYRQFVGNGETIRKMKPSDPLKPFHVDTKGTFYSPDNARHHFDLGYKYPKLQPWSFASENGYQANLETTINKTYAPPASTQLVMSNHDVVVSVSFEKFALGGVLFTTRVYLAGEPVGDVYSFSFVAESSLGSSSYETC
ncbi:hypothetical protein BKA70DRAFT_706629 [Coprinopsis sp. MPI-PUGE-AT-0042]|nr:hypothetical protein BKA70DRAFT_706629 [Coprinopsis sp. MPI-PUGE-AT-0042]